jgi:DNA-directed RNA polymerase specialized sigma subunit
MTERKTFKEKIRNSPVFSIDKEKDSALFQTERLKFIENLYLYWRKENKQKYSLEIVEAADSIIKYYDAEKGDIIHLFNSIMKKCVDYEQAKEIIDRLLGGIPIPEEKKRKIGQMKECEKTIKDEHLDISRMELDKEIARRMKISKSELKELQDINKTSVISLSAPIGDEEGSELGDKISDNKTNVDKPIEIKERLKSIENYFQKEKENKKHRKELLGKLLTVMVLKDLTRYYADWEEFLDGLSFPNREIIDEFKKNGELPLQRDIAQSYGVAEAHTSRLIGEFVKKIKKGG